MSLVLGRRRRVKLSVSLSITNCSGISHTSAYRSVYRERSPLHIHGILAEPWTSGGFSLAFCRTGILPGVHLPVSQDRRPKPRKLHQFSLYRRLRVRRHKRVTVEDAQDTILQPNCYHLADQRVRHFISASLHAYGAVFLNFAIQTHRHVAHCPRQWHKKRLFGGEHIADLFAGRAMDAMGLFLIERHQVPVSRLDVRKLIASPEPLTDGVHRSLDFPLHPRRVCRSNLGGEAV